MSNKRLRYHFSFNKTEKTSYDKTSNNKTHINRYAPHSRYLSNYYQQRHYTEEKLPKISDERLNQIQKGPVRILDATDTRNDYYTHPVDWSNDDKIVLALDEALYLYNFNDKKASKLYSIAGKNKIYNTKDYFVSVAFNKNSVNKNTLAGGQSNGLLSIFDTENLVNTNQYVNTDFKELCSLAWNGNVISAGFKTGNIKSYDIRQKNSIQETQPHCSNVCTIEYSTNGELFASGGNDNLVKIYSSKDISKPITIFDKHKAAVKGLSWCPYKINTIITGGGMQDKKIIRWDTQTGEIEKEIQMDSPVSYISHVNRYKEFVSFHGQPGNMINLWNETDFTLIKKIGDHDARILDGGISKDGRYLVSIGADDDLKFWEILEEIPERRESHYFR